MQRQPFSSGDLIADRRFEYAAALADEGDHAAAADLFRQTIERAPEWPSAWRALGRSLQALFDYQGAADAYRHCLRLDSSDALGAGLELARIDPCVVIDAAPSAYVAILFDAYARDFDAALVERLNYRAPFALADLLRAYASPADNAPQFSRALDLGCGTGLAGEALRRQTGYLEGVDLAPGMIAEAEKKRVYDALACADIHAHLAAAGDTFDLICAADVFTYLGDLSRIFAAIAARLVPGGLAAFTVEKSDAEPWEIRESLRFAHGEAYLREMAAANGFAVASFEETNLRRDRGTDIAGYLVVLKRSGQDSFGAAASALPCSHTGADVSYTN